MDEYIKELETKLMAMINGEPDLLGKKKIVAKLYRLYLKKSKI